MQVIVRSSSRSSGIGHRICKLRSAFKWSDRRSMLVQVVFGCNEHNVWPECSVFVFSPCTSQATIFCSLDPQFSTVLEIRKESVQSLRRTAMGSSLVHHVAVSFC